MTEIHKVLDGAWTVCTEHRCVPRHRMEARFDVVVERVGTGER